jgi:hypothetical protein
VRLSLLLLPFLLPIQAFASESSAQDHWKAFLTKPSARTYESLSGDIRACVVTSWHDAEVAGAADNFVNLYKLLHLVEHGNYYAMEIAVQIRPLYKNAAAPSEDIENSLGLSATMEPTFFLELMRKYDIPTGLLERLVLQTSIGSIDSLGAHREEWRRRIKSLSKVRDPHLLRLRDNAISFIQHEVDKYSGLPNDAWGQ